MRTWYTIVVFAAVAVGALVTAAPGLAQTLQYSRTDITVGSAPHGVLSADLNSDGALDVAVATFSSNTVAVLYNNAAGGFQSPRTTAVPSGPTDLVSADFNEDGRRDLAVTSFNGGRVSVLLGRSDGGFDTGAPIVISAPGGLVAEDLDGDGYVDLAVVGTDANRLQIYRGAGNATFTRVASLVTGARPNRVAAGDLTGDGRNDLAVSNLTSDDVSIYLNSGIGGFTTGASVAVGDGPVTPALGDIDGDGDLDLVTSNIGDGTVSIAAGTGTGLLQPATRTSVGGSPYTLTLADLNSDGRQDIAVTRSATGSIAVLLGSGGGSFGSPKLFTTASGAIGIATGDFTRDGYLDLAVSGFNSTLLSVLASGPRLHVAPTSLSFRVPAGEAATAIGRLVISNQGISPLRIRSLRLTGRDAGSFEASGCVGSPITPGGSCAITVTARVPSVSGTRSASLVLESNDASSPTSIPLHLLAYGRFTCRAAASRAGADERTVANAPNAPCRDDGASYGETAPGGLLTVEEEKAATQQTPDGMFTTRLRLGDGARSTASVAVASFTVGAIEIEAFELSAEASFLCRVGAETRGDVRLLTIDGQPVATDGSSSSIPLGSLGVLHVNHVQSTSSSASAETVRRALWFESAAGPSQDRVFAEARAGRDRGDPCI